MCVWIRDALIDGLINSADEFYRTDCYFILSIFALQTFWFFCNGGPLRSPFLTSLGTLAANKIGTRLPPLIYVTFHEYRPKLAHRTEVGSICLYMSSAWVENPRLLIHICALFLFLYGFIFHECVLHIIWTTSKFVHRQLFCWWFCRWITCIPSLM